MNELLNKFAACLLVTWLLVLQGVAAQTTPASPSAAQQQQVTAALQDRQLDEAELRNRLLARGVDVDNMSAEELAAAQPIIESVIAEMEAEAPRDTVPVPGSADQLPVRQGVSAGEMQSETAADSLQQGLEKSDIYGHQLFRNNSLQVYRTTDNVLPPDTYRLGTGDVISVSIFGASQADLKFTIDSEGFIRPPSMPRIYLRGIELGKARQLVESRFRQYYVFREGQFSLGLDAARTLTVNIFGEVEQTGSFTLSAVNSAFNALVAAGGPTDQGSVRKIKLLRGGEERLIDIYEFLLNPTRQADLFLENNDILFVPAATTIVTVKGAVRRPMRYELLEGEGLNTVLEFAGGLEARAVPEGITITRISGSKETVLDGNYVAGEGGPGLELRSSDVIEVRSAPQREQERVSISGDVVIPGNYAYVPGMRVSDLLAKGGLRPSSRRDVGFLRRFNADSTASLFPLSYFEVLENPAADLTLQTGDELIVFSQTTFARPATIAVSGAVNTPLSDYPYSANGQLTVDDALLLAGGLLPNAGNEAFLIRKNPANTEQQQYVRLELDDGFSRQRTLRPFDSLVVYPAELFNDPFPVSIRGAVRKPGTYVYDPSLGLRELLTLAGGLKLEAARNRIDVFRLQLNQDDATQTITTALEIDEELNVTGGPSGFAIRPYDVVMVRSVPEFELIHTVTVMGEVRYPGDYALDSDNLKLSDLVEKAGGLTAEAFPAGAVLYRNEKNVGPVVIQLAEVLKNPNSVANITVKDGDELRIPKARDLVAIYPRGTQAPQFVGDSLYLDGTLDVAFQGKHSAKWYVNHFAAGFADRALRRSLTVQYPNGELGRTKKFLIFNKYPEVLPGSTVRVDMKPPKRVRPEREEPVNWTGITQAVLGGITTTLTLYLLIDRVNQ